MQYFSQKTTLLQHCTVYFNYLIHCGIEMCDNMQKDKKK